MNKFSIYISLLCLSGCVSYEAINISANAKSYSCFKPLHKTVLAMKWNTCPLFSSKPTHKTINQSWEIIPIITPQNELYYQNNMRLQSKISKTEKSCGHPTSLSEQIELPKEANIDVNKMGRYYNKSFNGIIFEATVEVDEKQYEVVFRGGNMNKSDNVTGYNIDEYFKLCD